MEAAAAGGVSGDRCALRRDEIERPVLLQHPPLELLEPRRRIDPELVVERSAESLERLQRFGVPAAAVERQHQLASRPLAERMAADERLELGDELRLAPEGQLGVDALLEAGELLLDEPCLLQPGEGLCELRERHAAPQVQRTPQLSGGLVRAAVRERLPSPRMQLLEHLQVERVAVELEAVPGRPRLDQPSRKPLAELGDEDLHHLGRALRDVLAPEPVDEAIHRHDPARLEQQKRQQRRLLAAGQVDARPVVHGVERSENRELHVPPGDPFLRAPCCGYRPYTAGQLDLQPTRCLLPVDSSGTAGERTGRRHP